MAETDLTIEEAVAEHKRLSDLPVTDEIKDRLAYLRTTIADLFRGDTVDKADQAAVDRFCKPDQADTGPAAEKADTPAGQDNLRGTYNG